MNPFSRLTHSARRPSPELARPELIDAFIDSRALEYPTKIEDEFVQRALNLGVEGGMILDAGTRVGLIALKVLWQNENFYAIGMDSSSAMIERARETATAWGLGDRAFFQVGDARRMKLKTGYFDLVISDSTLHSFDDPVSVLAEISRVLKHKGALLIRELQRPSRLRMGRNIVEHTARYGARMREHVETALRGAFTRTELQAIVRSSGLVADIVQLDEHHLAIERRGETDPNSWIKAREQYL
ncbi:MAG: class I SAM-dependent methyltransferase [Acidobacteria bacterium]|nr:class I SAM-dependent methyltransferase [Acidobacteriota bacterium]